jgi:hypothetical protein
MEERKLGMVILAVVGVLALTGMVLLFKNITAMMGTPTYEQPASHKPAFVQPSLYLENFDFCQQYLCAYPGEVFYGESEPAATVGIDRLTGNLRCGCPDGHEFYIRPDLILEGRYS